MRRLRLPTLKYSSRLALRAAFVSVHMIAAYEAAQAQEAIQAIRLKEIKNPEKVDPSWIMGMCNIPGLECNAVNVPRLFERKTQSGVEYYATMEGLTLARLVMKAPGQWQLLNLWNFADYPLGPRKDEETGRYAQPATSCRKVQAQEH